MDLLMLTDRVAKALGSAGLRSGIEPGHVPGSRTLPQSNPFGTDVEKPMVTTCGSGITAAVLFFGAHLLGKEDVRLYDGSWSEWGADTAMPKTVGR